MKRLVVILLFLICSHTFAAPKISPELKNMVPRQEVNKLLAIAKRVFNKTVTAVEFVYRDEPPQGNSVAIVTFEREAVDENIYSLPAADFYYLPLARNHLLPAEKRKRIHGKWAFPGVLNRTNQYIIKISDGSVYIRFEPDLDYEEAFDLVTVIDSGVYDTESADTYPPGSILPRLDPHEIYLIGMDAKSNPREYWVGVNNQERGTEMWVFAKFGSRFRVLSVRSIRF